MKLYLASKFSLKEKVESISKILESEGHIITCHWWDDNVKSMQLKNNDDKDTAWYKHPEVIKICIRDYQGIDDCNALILISDEKKTNVI